MPTSSTISAPITVEPPRIRGSRFIAHLRQINSVEDARSAIAVIKHSNPDATHCAWAFRLNDGTEQCHDDGEVRGTAGPPILQRLRGSNLVHVLVVVVRYYGGVLLGKGGLIRAYGGATTAAIAAADLIEHIDACTLRISCSYALQGPLTGIIAEHSGQITQTAFSTEVCMHITVPSAHADALQHALRERASGQITMETTAAIQRSHLGD